MKKLRFCYGTWQLAPLPLVDIEILMAYARDYGV